MKFQEILDLPDKAVVDSIEGRVVRVFDPFNPSPAQHKAGIHKQEVTIQDAAGTDLTLQLMQKESHLLPSCEGSMFHFRSVSDQGLTVNRWKGERGETFAVQVDRKAHFYQIEEKPEARAAYEASKPQIGDLIGFYCTIMRGIESDLAGSEVLAAMLQNPESLASATATVFIEGCRQGMWKKSQLQGESSRGSVTSPPAVNVTAETKGNPVAESPPVNGAVQCPVTLGEIADLITGGTPTEAVRDLCNGLGTQPDFPHVYDIVVENLEKEGYARRDIDMAHDRVKKLIQQKTDKPLNDAVLYKSICFNFDGFRKQLELLVPKKKEPAPHGDLVDDEGLPSLDD